MGVLTVCITIAGCVWDFLRRHALCVCWIRDGVSSDFSDSCEAQSVQLYKFFFLFLLKPREYELIKCLREERGGCGCVQWELSFTFLCSNIGAEVWIIARTVGYQLKMNDRSKCWCWTRSNWAPLLILNVKPDMHTLLYRPWCLHFFIHTSDLALRNGIVCLWVKCLMDYWMDCYEIWFRHPHCRKDWFWWFLDFDLSVSMPIQWVWVKCLDNCWQIKIFIFRCFFWRKYSPALLFLPQRLLVLIAYTWFPPVVTIVPYFSQSLTNFTPFYPL